MFAVNLIKMSDKEEGEKTIATDIVVTKYKMAGEMVNRKYHLSSLLMCTLHVV